ncbi:MAG: hypothetical protein IT184_10515 [Acidobacteria bacterium]|nr:hypothetical protein [Acidobacteriota bacterium]
MPASTRLLLLVYVAFTARAAIAQPPLAGVIRGRVTATESAVRLNRPTVADPSNAPPQARQRAVVYLQTAPREAFGELPAGRARMDQRGEQFVPHVLAVTAGTIVEFPNNDKTFHNVFSLSRTKTFDLGRFAPGRTGAIRFDRPGIVPVFCDIHSHMSAYVLVFSHPFFAVSDAEGRYEIAGVPPGTYTLNVWSELGSAPARRVTVSEATPAEADFQIGPAR